MVPCITLFFDMSPRRSSEEVSNMIYNGWRKVLQYYPHKVVICLVSQIVPAVINSMYTK
jgi:hypothetical protein